MLGNTLTRRAKAMFPRFGGKVGEYLWELERERLKRYKDRPWELQSRASRGNPLLVLLFISLGIVAIIFLFSLFQ